MRVEVRQAPKKEKSYPWVGKKECTGTTVLFTGPNRGVVLEASDPKRVGYYGTGWDESGFLPVDSVTLYND